MSCHLMFMAPGPPERETILLLSSLSCHCCLLSVSTPIRSLISPVTANSHRQPDLPHKSFLGGSVAKQFKRIPPECSQSVQPLPCTSVSPRKITGGQLHHGQGELGSPARANRSGEARPWSQAGTNPSHTSSHQLTLQFGWHRCYPGPQAASQTPTPCG